jgi:hypothetical protein
VGESVSIAELFAEVIDSIAPPPTFREVKQGDRFCFTWLKIIQRNE